MMNVRSSGVEEGLIGAVAQFACTRGGGREVAEALGLPDERLDPVPAPLAGETPPRRRCVHQAGHRRGSRYLMQRSGWQSVIPQHAQGVERGRAGADDFCNVSIHAEVVLHRHSEDFHIGDTLESSGRRGRRCPGAWPFDDHLGGLSWVEAEVGFSDLTNR